MKFIGSDMERREGLIAALLELLCFVDWWKHKKWEKPTNGVSPIHDCKRDQALA